MPPTDLEMRRKAIEQANAIDQNAAQENPPAGRFQKGHRVVLRHVVPQPQGRPMPIFLAVRRVFRCAVGLAGLLRSVPKHVSITRRCGGRELPAAPVDFFRRQFREGNHRTVGAGARIESTAAGNIAGDSSGRPPAITQTVL